MAEGNGEEVAWLEGFVEQVRHWHDEIINQSGGLHGERTTLLYAACARPFHSAFGDDAYPSDLEKAAVLFHGIVCDHPFVDGNKRTGTIAAILLLAAVVYLSDPPSRLQVRLLGELAVEAAEGDLGVESAIDWFDRILGQR